MHLWVKRTLKIGWLLSFSVASFVALAQSEQEIQHQQQLDRIQQQIKKVEAQLKNDKQDAVSLQRKLKQSELLEAELAKAVNATRKELKRINVSLADLTEQQTQLKEKQKQQQEILAKTIASAYRTGSHDFSKMLLNIESASSLERMISYFRYLNDARVEQLEAFQVTVNELTAVNAQLLDEEAQLSRTEAQQTEQQKSVTANRKNRQQTLSKLRKNIATEQQQLSQLQEDEMRLAETLEQLQQQALANPTLNGLKAIKGKIKWPYKARLKRRFGTQKQGQMRWKGVVMEGRTGASINNIARGRIVYSDWLNGYGLLVVIDHGEGYMSLYGYNQAIIGEVGDIVEAGEPIALMGQSGGQSKAGLYFEIRHKGKALNPSKWCR